MSQKTYKGDYSRLDWLRIWSGICCKDETNLQNPLNLLHVTFKRFHLQINVSKIKTMIVNYRYAM